jgi:pimeloyl-ACP methyl ester carboxylesterase
MTVTTSEQMTSTSAIRPFTVEVPQAEIDALRARVASTRWPDEEAEIYPAPRSWGERAFGNLIYWNEVDGGGHFAAWEQPQVFASEVRAAFRSLR